MTTSLNEHLMDLNADLLKGWLRRAGGLDKGVTRKADLAAAIERLLTTNLAAVLACLSEGEKALLAEYGGACPMPRPYYGWR